MAAATPRVDSQHPRPFGAFRGQQAALSSVGSQSLSPSAYKDAETGTESRGRKAVQHISGAGEHIDIYQLPALWNKRLVKTGRFPVS